MYSDDPNYLINIGHKEDPNLSDEDAYDFGKHMRDLNIDYMTSGPVMLLLFVGEDAVSLIRKIVGDSDPSKAEKGTIRRMSDDSFADAAKRDDTVRNLVHVPDSIENASREILLFLGNDEAFMTQLRISAPSMFGSDKAYEV
jgi:nucleoside-diphosphate kinase